MTKIPSKTRILTSARALFFAKGFEHVSTDELAREAGVSKASIYRYFKNMPDILECIAEAEAAKFQSVLPRDIDTLDALQAALTDFGVDALQFLNLKEIIDFSRLIHEVARTNAQLGQTFYTAAVERVCGDLTALFANAQSNGLCKRDFAPKDIAEDFAALLQGFGVVRAQLRVSEQAFDDIDGRVRRAVRTIVAAHAITERPGAKVLLDGKDAV